MNNGAIPYIVGFLLMSLSLYKSQAQETGLQRWSASGGVYSSAYSLEDAKNLFSTVREVYRQQGIPLADQTDYPANWKGTVVGLYRLGNAYHIGVGSGYGSTSAYSLYGDVAGSVNLISHVKLTDVCIILRVMPDELSTAYPIVQAEIGPTFIGYTLRQEVYTESGVLSGESRVDASGSFFRYAGTLGVGKNIGLVSIIARLGAHFGSTGTLDGESFLNGVLTSRGKFPLKIDISGLDFGFEVGIHF